VPCECRSDPTSAVAIVAPRPRKWAAALRAALLFALGVISNVGAQPLPCFPTLPTPGWTAGDLDLESAGASRPLPGDRLELCSASPGFAPDSDAYRYLIQRADGDFAFSAAVESIDDRGLGGIVVRWDQRSRDAAYVRIAAHRRGDGDVLIRSAMRRNNGVAAEESVAAVAAHLPVRLRIERVGDVFVTSWGEIGDGLEQHLAVDAGGDDLASSPLVIGLAQASEDSAAAASAIFGEAGFATHEPVDPNRCVGGLVTPLAGGRELFLTGRNLDLVRNASIAGIPARIVRQTPDSLRLETGAAASTIGYKDGKLQLGGSTGAAPVELPQRIAYAGEPFVRGDIDGDGRVGPADLVPLSRYLLGRAALQCREAADVDGDRKVDPRDLARLILYSAFGRPAPPAPFPRPGFAPEGGFSCGLPPPPTLESVRVKLAPTRGRSGVAVGDEIVLKGHGFARGAGLLVQFGDAAMTVLPASNERELHLRVDEVPTGGRKCPVVLVTSSDETDTGDAGIGLVSLNRLGVAWAAPQTGRPDLCPTFEAGPARQVTSARLLPQSSALLLPVKRANWNPSEALQVRIQLYLPVVDGLSRGARVVRFVHYDPPDPSRSGPGTTYEEWLARLARRITVELNGTAAEDCGCDAEAVADPQHDGVVIRPCDPVLTWEDPGPGPEPPFPGIEFPLRAPRPPLWGATTFKQQEPDFSDPADPETMPRQYMWCQFAKLIAPNVAPASGLPKWEHFVSSLSVHGQTSVADLADPNDRSAAEKFILFSPSAYADAVTYDYAHALEIAARRYYCLATGLGSDADWMPAFDPASRVLKTFFLTESKLPKHADPDDYYSYQPPSGERQYLAGMHMAVSTGAIFSYFRWATFFVVKPPGDTEAKDGSPLAWNTSCSAGSFANRPVEITGVWQNYVMCTDSADGEEHCGNPWGPSNECHQVGCNGCHVQIGKVITGGPGLGEIATGWLPTFASDAIRTGFEQINAWNCLFGVGGGGLFDLGGLYRDLAPPQCDAPVQGTCF
jgi:hypothetical protein